MTYSTNALIRTPKGRVITLRRYIALTHMRQHSRNGASPCEHGHFSCAAWDGGPCEAEHGPQFDPED